MALLPFDLFTASNFGFFPASLRRVNDEKKKERERQKKTKEELSSSRIRNYQHLKRVNEHTHIYMTSNGKMKREK